MQFLTIYVKILYVFYGGNIMLEILEHTLLDSLNLIPFLLITYIILETIEHKMSKKTEKIIEKSGKLGPILGGLLGIIPQCGFSAMASNFYVARIITRGTLIAIFLSTSDEMLPILISNGTGIGLILKILSIKAIIGIIVGFLVDVLYKNHIEDNKQKEIGKICEGDHCECNDKGIFISSLKHTIQIFIYIFGISLILNILIHLIGEQTLANFVVNIPIIGVILSTLIGIIPNCASSVILTQLYLEQIITFGSLIAGLLVNSGLGVLILFKVNKKTKDNMFILSILFIVGIISGVFIDLLI